MKMTLLSLLLALTFLASATAQNGKTFFQTFDVKEISSVEFNIPNEFVLKKWVNQSAILVESTVQLTNLSDATYKHVISSGRYDLTELEDEGTKLVIVAKNSERNIIRTSVGEAVESIKVTIYVPQDFELVNGTTIIRKAQTEVVLPNKVQED